MAITLTPWRHIATPHEDVLGDSFTQAEFAADLTKVVQGKAKPDYQDAAQFFARTVITTGMHRLLVDVLKRMNGRGSDPVVQLKTSFGGGKTHTLLAVYHTVCTDCATSALPGMSKLLDEAKVTVMPQGKVVVLDGNQLSPSAPSVGADGIERHTLAGEIAYQLGGAEGYALVEKADKDGTSPGKQALQPLLERYAPCVILLDEAVAYLRQFQPGRSYVGGTFDSVLSTIQALTESVSAVPQAMLLASLPESEAELGGQGGQQALASLERLFGRQDAVWEPVAARESYEIIKRRLFKSDIDEAARDTVCRQYAEYYQQNKEHFPPECSTEEYVRKLKSTYPIHPELLQRLYEDWSTLEKFQRTRGVLRLMAQLISLQWSGDNQEPMIMPGSLDLADRDMRVELTKYLDGEWQPIVTRDVDGRDATSYKIDDANPTLGGLRAASRAARTVFLATAPSATASGATESIRGVDLKYVLLGQPNPGRLSGTTRMPCANWWISRTTSTMPRSGIGTAAGRTCGARWRID